MPRRVLCRLSAPLLVLLVVGCATAPGADIQRVVPPVGWRAGAQEHIALWYHGLAHALPPVETFDTLVLPRFEPGYVAEVTGTKRQRGLDPTPLEQRAAAFGQLFRTEGAYQGLQFLPLYFASWEALRSGIDLWVRLGGDPRRATTAESARVVGFLTSLFPRAIERQAIADWKTVLEEEHRLFHMVHWQERAAALEGVAAAVQRDWDAIAPALTTYLDYLQIRNGELFLVPALGAEGRIVTRGAGILPRAAVLSPSASQPQAAVLAFLHELAYPIAGEAIVDHVSPARIREIGDAILAGRAAVHGGAMLLERADPGRVPDYQRFFLEAAGRRPAPAGETLQAAFDAAFPIPAELASGLRVAIQQAMAGI